MFRLVHNLAHERAAMSTQEGCNVWAMSACVLVLELSCLVKHFASKMSNAENSTVVTSCWPKCGMVAARRDNGLGKC
jgi:hypothetical protein